MDDTNLAVSVGGAGRRGQAGDPSNGRAGAAGRTPAHCLRQDVGRGCLPGRRPGHRLPLGAGTPGGQRRQEAAASQGPEGRGSGERARTDSTGRRPPTMGTAARWNARGLVGDSPGWDSGRRLAPLGTGGTATAGQHVGGRQPAGGRRGRQPAGRALPSRAASPSHLPPGRREAGVPRGAGRPDYTSGEFARVGRGPGRDSPGGRGDREAGRPVSDCPPGDWLPPGTRQGAGVPAKRGARPAARRGWTGTAGTENARPETRRNWRSNPRDIGDARRGPGPRPGGVDCLPRVSPRLARGAPL
jgi:hypothetical protein